MLDAVIAAIEALDASSWNSPVPDDGRTVAVVAHHIAAGYEQGMVWMRQLLAGEPLLELTVADCG